jgi:colicin import membrane protein
MMKQKRYSNHFFISLLLHAVMLTVLVVSFEFSGKMPVLENSDKNSEIVNAVVINDSKIQMPKPSLLPPPKAPEAPVKPIPEIKKSPAPTPPTPVKKEVAPLPAPPKKAIAIPDPRKKLMQKELIEKQLLADLQKQTDKQKKAKQKALEAAFAKEMKEHAAKSLEQQFLKESNELASAQSQKMQGIVDKYKALILQAIGQNWLVPPNANKKLSSELLIRVAPGGMVLDVQLVKSSGDVSLDRSARAAVFKASPLPVPTNTDEFEPFRQFILKVKPENVATVS